MKIGLVLDNLNGEYQQAIYNGIVKEAERNSLTLVCIQVNAFYRKENPLVKIFELHRDLDVQAYLVLSSLFLNSCDKALYNSLEKLLDGKPVIFIGGKYDDHVTISVNCEKALRDLVRHLVDQHDYRRFLFIGGPDKHSDNINRIAIIKKTLDEYRKDKKYQDISLDVKNGCFFAENIGYELIKDYSREHPERNCDVIMAGSDYLAIGCMTFLHSHASKSWQDCPVTGFDNIPDSIMQEPPLTTISQPYTEIGRQAVISLLGLLDGKEVPGEIMVEAELVLRESCLCESFHADLIPDIREMGIYYNKITKVADKFGQILMDADSIEGLKQILDYFLDENGIKIFHFVLFETEQQTDRTMCRHLFSRQPELDINEDRVFPVNELAAFWSSVMSSENRPSFHYYIFQLRSAEELLGFVLYGADDRSYLAISNRSIYLANIIKRLQLQEKDKAYTRELERLVELRSKKLAEEMARRIEVEAEVLRISELERQRFSLDIHDDICQRMASLALMCRGLSGNDPRLERVSYLLEETLQLTRQYAYDSFPLDLNAIGLGNALQQLCIDTGEQSGIECILEKGCEIPKHFTTRETMNIYRIIQEAVHNSIKHSKAEKINLQWSCSEKYILFSISDDGEGNPEIAKTQNPVQTGRRPRGLGLRSMQYRADQLNAAFSIVSSKKEGTTIILKVPVILEKKNG